MPEMKDSGIEWIKQIPNHWNITRGKNILQLMKRLPEQNDEVVTCFRDGEVTLRKNRREEGFTFSDKEIGYQGIKKGDIVIHGMDGFAGAIGISDSDGKGSPVLVVCTTKENARYIVYYLRVLADQGVFVALATGIRERSCDLRWNKIADLLFPIPGINEQYRIANYLDHKCSQIDAIIARQQEVIEKLKAYKLSVISEAVTKGLEPNVPMKDSGIEWIGKIPEHWSESTILRNIRFVGGSQPPLEYFIDEPREGYVRLIQNRDYRTDDYATYVPVTMVSKFCTKEDVMIGRYGPPIFVIHRGLEGAYNVALMKAVPVNIDREFMFFYLQNSTLLKYIESFSVRTAGQSGVNPNILKRYPMFIPPIEEQKQIAKSLRQKCHRIDGLIISNKNLVEKLVSYKKALIYEVVTGKKSV